MNVTLHKCPCHVLSLDIVDVTGVHVVDVKGNLSKLRIDKNGKKLERKDMIAEMKKGSFKEQAEETLNLLREGLKDQEGCRVEGTVIINKVPGNFHISTHA